MNITTEIILGRAQQAAFTYGHIRSTHEALGVALEEWNELQAAIWRNDAGAIRNEAIDLAAVLVRLADTIMDQMHCDARHEFWARSGLDNPR